MKCRAVRALALVLMVAAARVAVAEPPPVRVSGSVSHQGGIVVGVRVYVLQQARFSGAARPEVLAHGLTDAGGRFDLAVPWPGDLIFKRWSVAVDAGDWAPVVVDLTEELSWLEPGSRLEVGGLALTEGCAASGRVMIEEDGEERGLQDAEVVASLEGYPRVWRATTDATGTFRFEDLPPGHHALGVAHPDWAARRLPVEVDCSAAAAELDPVVLRAAAPMRFRVLLETGEPAAGVRYAFGPSPPAAVWEPWLTETTGWADPEGRFAVPVEEGAAPWRLELTLQGWQGARIRWSRPIQVPDEPPTFTLRSPRRVDGTLRDVFGGELGGGEVEVYEYDVATATAAQQPLTIVAASDRGRFDSGPLPPGDYLIEAWAAGYLEAERVVSLPAEAPHPLRVEMELASEDHVIGRFAVLDAEGSPLAGVEIEVFPYEPRILEDLGCHTGPAGTCEIAGIPAGEAASVSIALPGFDVVYERVARIDPEELMTLRFDEPGWETLTVDGTVVRAVDGSAIVGARVELSSSMNAGFERATRTDREGHFEFHDVAEGVYAVAARVAELAPSIRNLKVTPELEPVELALSAGATVSGRLLDAPREYDYGWMTVRRALAGPARDRCGDPPLALVADGFPSPAEGEVEGDRYRVEHLPSGRWQLDVYLDSRLWTGRVEVADGADALTVDLELVEPCPAEARREEEPAPVGPRNEALDYAVVYASGIPLRGCLALELVDAAGTVVADDFCADASGRWSDLPRGTFDLRMQALGREAAWPVTLPGPARRLVLPPGGALELRVLDAELTYADVADWRAGLRVTLTPIGQGDDATAIEAHDRTHFSDLAPGWWQVDVEAPNDRRWSELVEIRDGNTRKLVFR